MLSPYCHGGSSQTRQPQQQNQGLILFCRRSQTEELLHGLNTRVWFCGVCGVVLRFWQGSARAGALSQRHLEVVCVDECAFCFGCGDVFCFPQYGLLRAGAG